MKLEEEMFRFSAESLEAEINKAKGRGSEDTTPYSARLMVAKLEAVALGVQAELDKAASGRAMNRGIAIKFLRPLEPEVSAAIALRGVLIGVTKQRSLQNSAVLIGRMVEDELMWRAFKAQAPEAAKITARKIDQAASERHRRRVAGVMAGRAGVERVEMSLTERLNVGLKLLDIVIETTGMVERVSATAGQSDGAGGKRDRMYYIAPTPETLYWIERFTKWHAMMSPEWWPMVAPPKPWTGPQDGGYFTRQPRPMPLVKNARRAYLAELEGYPMPDVYAAVNAVQSTAYKIDEWVLGVLERVWNMDLGIAGLIKRAPEEVPAKPADIDTNEDARKDWRKRAALVYTNNVRLLSKRVQIDQGIKMARRFADEPALYFPHQYDFRGRMYAVPFLSYQGPDWMKGMLRFAEGKPIDNPDAALWLMIQGANLWGEDKGTIEEREDWVEKNEEQIKLAGADPFASYWWTEADKPWQFLQWCREWTQFLAQGYGFVSSFICSADGACNGLQHFSAMLRDPVGGCATNLCPAERPSDIYAKVAEVVEGKLRLMASATGGNAAAQRWLDFGLDRKVTKRAVMVLPYGGTQYSTREFIEEAIREKLEDGKLNTFAEGDSDGIFAASLFLAPLVWESIGEVVIAARDAMGWLKAVAHLVAQETKKGKKDGKPVDWTTPDGFKVRQEYFASKQKIVELQMSGTRIRLAIREEQPHIDKRRQEQGVAPNFVHSCDGTALRQYVLLGKANGITSFAMVHDSFGAPAADYLTMQACLRTAFVDLYENHDVLEELRSSIASLLTGDRAEQLPPVPSKGDLNLQEVMDSEFFFA